MLNLSSVEYSAAFDLVGTMGALPSPSERATFALEATGRLIPCDVCSITVVDLRTRCVASIDWPSGTCSRTHLETLARLVDTHPVIAHCARTRDFRPHRLSDFVTRQRWESSALYAEFYRTLALRHELVSVVPTSATHWICVGLDRSDSCSDFTERDQTLVSLIIPSLAHVARTIPGAQSEPPPGGLTAREHEILRFVCRGATNREIGDELGISARTVQSHLKHVFEKLGVRTRTAAAARALWTD